MRKNCNFKLLLSTLWAQRPAAYVYYCVDKYMYIYFCSSPHDLWCVIRIKKIIKTKLFVHLLRSFMTLGSLFQIQTYKVRFDTFYIHNFLVVHTLALSYMCELSCLTGVCVKSSFYRNLASRAKGKFSALKCHVSYCFLFFFIRYCSS